MKYLHLMQDNELSFAPGDRITITELCNKDWYEGCLAGKQAYFPANYVRIVDDSSLPRLKPAASATTLDSNATKENVNASRNNVPLISRLSLQDVQIIRPISQREDSKGQASTSVREKNNPKDSKEDSMKEDSMARGASQSQRPNVPKRPGVMKFFSDDADYSKSGISLLNDKQGHHNDIKNCESNDKNGEEYKNVYIV